VNLGTVEGVRLQLSGQRADALWQTEVDACALSVDVGNRALFKLGQLLAVAKLGSESRNNS
jgi:hypothetical protein